MLRGRCLCGSVVYEIDGVPVVVAHCDCRDCQRSRADWDALDPSLPAFPAQPAWRPGDAV
ncbi:MAG: hypothetical protein WEF50_23810 [Myxococcota bacterium]